MALDAKYNSLRDVINECTGYRILDDEDTLRQGDETACGSLLLSTTLPFDWQPIAKSDGWIGRTVAWANDEKRKEMDATERLFRRKVKR